MNRRASVAVAAIVAIFLVVQLGALALVEPFKSAGFQDVQDPSDPTNSILYVGAILVATAVMLAAIRYDAQVVIRLLVIGSSAFITYYVFSVLAPAVVTVGAVNAVAVGLGLLVGAALWLYPEWYVIDAAGIVMGAGAAGLFGINFGVLPAIVLLVVLAVYDAISVYGTEHMLTLASGVMELRLPVVLVIPLTLSYSFLDASTPETAKTSAEREAEAKTKAATTNGGGEGAPDDEPDDPFERDAFFIGLGDAVMPTILVASAGFFQPGGAPTLGVSGLAMTLPALTAMVGTLLGLLVLMWAVMKGRAHAGLPLLNGGAIAGYLIGALAVGVPLVEALGLGPWL